MTASKKERGGGVVEKPVSNARLSLCGFLGEKSKDVRYLDRDEGCGKLGGFRMMVSYVDWFFGVG